MSKWVKLAVCILAIVIASAGILSVPTTALAPSLATSDASAVQPSPSLNDETSTAAPTVPIISESDAPEESAPAVETSDALVPSVAPETTPRGVMTEPIPSVTSDYSICIPSIGYAMALDSHGDPQAVVDNPGTAYYGLEDLLNHHTIADHARQGLHDLRDLPVGTTGALILGGHQTTIREIATMTGYNTGTGLYADSGESVWGMYPNTYIIYTCLDASGYSVVITFWEAEA